MIKISREKIKLEDKLIDLSSFEIRPKVTEQDLERYYDSFIEHTSEIRDYFENQELFDKAVIEASKEKRPRLVSREPKYPFMWIFRSAFLPFDFLNPEKRRLHNEYFMGAHCITCIQRKRDEVNKEENDQKEKRLDERLGEEIREKFNQYPGYEGIIEIPNDNNQSQTKSTTFHEALHYLIFRYQAETERSFVKNFVKEELTPLKKYRAEYIIHERIVEILTDKLLSHDPDAQFEARWTEYSVFNEAYRPLIGLPSAVAAGLLIVASIDRPYLAPLVLVPGRIREYAYHKYKQSKKEKLSKPREYPSLKI